MKQITDNGWLSAIPIIYSLCIYHQAVCLHIEQRGGPMQAIAAMFQEPESANVLSAIKSVPLSTTWLSTPNNDI